ncbi:AzlC family ABC transporter permease [Aquabacter sp. L1I39]|nr:AzlC family ABC transporter permease [Aquabacter sp. L1I39]
MASPAPRGTLGWFAHGARCAVSVPGFVLFAGYIGYGGLLHGVGFPFVAGVLSTFFIWALPGQVIMVGGLVSGTALPAIALAVALSSIRLLPMVVSIAPLMRGPRRSLWKDLVCAHFVAMTVWVEGQRLLPHVPMNGRPPFVLGFGLMLLVFSMTGTAAGFLLAGELPASMGAGLLFMTPMSFTLLLIRGARDTTDWLALAFGTLTAPFVVGMSGGADLMITGFGGGTAAYLVGRWWRRRR